MSYCRFTKDSDVYAYDTWGHGENDTVVMCWLSNNAHQMGFKDTEFEEYASFLAYLKELRDAGLLVPQHVFDVIEAEIKAGHHGP